MLLLYVSTVIIVAFNVMVKACCHIAYSMTKTFSLYALYYSIKIHETSYTTNTFYSIR